MNQIKKSPSTPKKLSKPCFNKINSQMSTTSFTTIDSIDSPHHSYFKGLNSSQTIAQSPKIFNSQIQDASISPINSKKGQNPHATSKNNNEFNRMLSFNKTAESFNQFGSEMSTFMKSENSEFSTLPVLSQKTFSQFGFQEITEQNEDGLIYDDEEEHCIWQDSKLEEMGVDTDNYLNKCGDPLTFYQLYRLRSNAYQPEYISRLDTMKEVKVISTHYRKGIRMSVLKQQQQQLDQQFTGQTRSIIQQIQQQNEVQSPRNVSQLVSQNINNISPNVSIYQKIAKKSNQSRNQNRSEKQQQSYKSPTKNDLVIFENFQISDSSKSKTHNKKDSSSKQYISKQIANNTFHNQNQKKQISSPVLKEQNQKTENKIIPVKTINLNNQLNFQGDSSLEDLALSIEDFQNQDKQQNYKQDLKIQKESSIILDLQDKQAPHSDQLDSSIALASESVIKYLKQITNRNQSALSRQRERFNQQNVSYNQLYNNMRISRKQEQQQKLNKRNIAQESVKTVKINISYIESKQDKLNEQNQNHPINFDINNIYSQLAISKQQYKIDSYLNIQSAK